MHLRLRRPAADAIEARSPGFRAAVEAIATATDDTHYTVPADAYRALLQQHASARPSPPSVRRRKRLALGDAVESMLTRLGITKERVQAWTRTKDCGCAARQKWLNQWGFKKQEQLERLLQKAARWYGIS